MNHKLQSTLSAIVLAALVLTLAVTPTQAASAPTQLDRPQQLSFEKFVSAVANGQAGVVRGVYVADVLALRVDQQPANRPDYVNATNGRATQFQTAAYFDVIGLLAHNYRSGALFFKLQPGHEVKIVYGDRTIETYLVSAIYQYQALQPNDTRGDLVDLTTGQQVSVIEAFNQVYTGDKHVTFQTCIRRAGNAAWGRYFVVATPIP